MAPNWKLLGSLWCLKNTDPATCGLNSMLIACQVSFFLFLFFLCPSCWSSNSFYYVGAMEGLPQFLFSKLDHLCLLLVPSSSPLWIYTKHTWCILHPTVLTGVHLRPSGCFHQGRPSPSTELCISKASTTHPFVMSLQAPFLALIQPIFRSPGPLPSYKKKKNQSLKLIIKIKKVQQTANSSVPTF